MRDLGLSISNIVSLNADEENFDDPAALDQAADMMESAAPPSSSPSSPSGESISPNRGLNDDAKGDGGGDEEEAAITEPPSSTVAAQKYHLGSLVWATIPGSQSSRNLIRYRLVNGSKPHGSVLIYLCWVKYVFQVYVTFFLSFFICKNFNIGNLVQN